MRGKIPTDYPAPYKNRKRNGVFIMKILSRIFSVLTYAALSYVLFTALIAVIALHNSADYAAYGVAFEVLAVGGLLAAVVLNILKCKWSSFFVLAGTSLVRVYIGFLMVNNSAVLEMTVFYKHHLPALLVVLFALLSTLCYKKYKKAERGVTFQKTEKDREIMEEKALAAEEEPAAE